MEDTEKTICRPEGAANGPCDAVQLKTQCVRSDFTENEDGTVGFNQNDNSEANISASVELGIFSIRDKESGVMLTITFEDALMVMATALDAAKEIEGVSGEEKES